MHRSVISAYADRPILLDELELLENELGDIEHDDMALTYNKSKKCIMHQFRDEVDVEYAVLQHWSDHVGVDFTITEEPDKKGLFSAFILV